MESCRFDSITRRFAATSDRRAAMKGLAAGIAAVGLARVGVASAQEDVIAAKCGDKGDRCFGNTDCCQGLKCKGGDRQSGKQGNCAFKNGHGGQGDWCKKDNQCKSKNCNNDNRKCR